MCDYLWLNIQFTVQLMCNYIDSLHCCTAPLPAPQWQSRHGARLWFHGELGLARNYQRNWRKALLPLQPRKPWHFLRGTSTETQSLWSRSEGRSCSFLCVWQCVYTVPVCSATASVWSLCRGLSVSAVHRPVWRGWGCIPHTPASTTSGTCPSTSSYGK